MESVEVINVYGPTEATIWSTCKRLDGTDLNIGTPLVNETVYILSEDNMPVPIGVSGEICIGGDGLARGYYQQPELTAEKFIPHPFLAGERIYRTGDQGRWLPGGDIECLGRNDDQVKVRGFRIELGEIEHRLKKHSAVSGAVVVAREVDSTTRELVAYVTSREELSISALRRHLAKTLPDYMIPSHFVPMERFPLTPNGKIDKKALPGLDGPGLRPEATYVPPRNDVERAITAIWESVLGRERLGVYDNFFEAGGHSLKATRIVSRAHRELGVEVGLREFFSAPTIAGLAALIRRKAPSAFIRIEPVPKRDHYEVSHAQRRLWVLDRMEDGSSAAYNMPGAYLVEGRCDIEALRHAFRALVERHESLRTTFIAVDGEPRQRIGDGSGIEMEEIDLGKGSTPQIPDLSMAMTIAAREAATPFDLERGPLLRVKLLTLAEDRRLLILNMHHIISDAWSMGVMARELRALYTAFAQAGPAAPPLPPPRIQYKDYAAWQNAMLRSDAAREDEAYWLEKLSGEIPVLDLPVDFPRPSVQTYKGATLRLPFPEETAAELRSIAREHDATLFMVLLTLLQVLLHRTTGQQDIIIGSPVAGRGHPDLESQVGFYVNTLALRNTVQGTHTFSDILELSKQTVAEAFDHQLYPFDTLVDRLALDRDVSRHPLFSVMLVTEDQEAPQPDPTGLSISALEIESAVSKLDLAFQLTQEAGGGLRLAITYNTDLFAEETVRGFASHLEELARSAVRKPGKAVRELEIIGEAERHRLLVDFNATQRDFPQGGTIIDMFKAQAAATPENIALIVPDGHSGYRQITYRELNEIVAVLACSLREQCGVRHEDLVGVIMDRSEWLIIALLGILEAGGAYLPLDPGYPAERLRYMIEDSQCRVLLTAPTAEACETHGDARAQIVNIHALLRKPASDACSLTESSGRATARADVPARPLAYVIYTSGSTGRPKGVMVEHEGFVNMSLDQIRGFGITASDRVVLFSSPSFDASLSEIFMALLCGAALVIVDRDILSNTGRFLRAVKETGITVATLPPAYLNALSRADISPLRVLITAGEPALVSDALHYARGLHYFNAYGPTENSVCATYHRVNPERAYRNGIPIGKPIANVTIHILDEDLRMAPAGVPGEICIGGVGLARGYLGMPEATAERFVSSPFNPAERLYRTGDLGRWLPAGEIEFLGRIDDQVKVRGYRIELGEIEHVLLLHPGVREAVVVARDIRTGSMSPGKPGGAGRELVAYIVGEAARSPQALRAHANRFIPDFMIPSRFVPMESLPLTPNGKVDKKALPDPHPFAAGTAASRTPPRSPLEERLADIWGDVLKQDRPGIHDNFFELGGNSLQAVQIVSKIDASLGHNLPVRALFLHPTIASLAEMMTLSPPQPVSSPPDAGDPNTEGRSGTEDKVTASPPRLPTRSLVVESRPLLSLLTSGRIAPVDAAALGYLPDSLAHASGLDRDTIRREWCDDMPVPSSILQTSMGRIAVILLPRFASEINRDEADLTRVILEAVGMASHMGARTVSLTGMLPTATDYGRTIPAAHSGALPAITTGHATTAASLVMAIEGLYKVSGRSPADELVGLVGIGSMGRASMLLMLKLLPHPREIVLSDPFTTEEDFRLMANYLTTETGFRGTFRIASSAAPPEIYDATLIVTTTNLPDILDISRLRPGCMLVDDAGTYGFNLEEAHTRAESRGDILFTAGDALHSPTPIEMLMHIPLSVRNALGLDPEVMATTFDPHEIRSCILSSLLSRHFEDLPPTIGTVKTEDCLAHHQKLTLLGFHAARLHCEEYRLSDQAIEAFRDRFGGKRR